MARRAGRFSYRWLGRRPGRARVDRRNPKPGRRGAATLPGLCFFPRASHLSIAPMLNGLAPLSSDGRVDANAYEQAFVRSVEVKDEPDDEGDDE